MLTPFGRFIRKTRLDTGHLLKETADYLGVTSSYLSAVETGKRKIPADWGEKLASFFSLDACARGQLIESIQDSQDELQIDLSGSSKQQRELAFAFARKLEQLDEHEIQGLIDSIRKMEEEHKQ